MIKLGIIGWRGLVGSILINRIKNSKIIKFIEIYLFSTNNVKNTYNAYNYIFLKNMNIIISCQGSNYTKFIINNIFLKNWKGYWIDASSYLRMNNNCCLILDCINKSQIIKNIKKYNIFSGCNCTVSLCLISIKNLLKKNLIDWILTTSYQAVSGAGYKMIKFLIKNINNSYNLSNNLLIMEKQLKYIYKKQPLLYNAIPWIDIKKNFGQTNEEQKSIFEATKILNKKIIIDSNCVRINSLRCHSQMLNIKIKKKISLENFYELLNNNFTEIIKNNQNSTIDKLSPFFVSGKLKIFIGRIRKNLTNSNVFNFFSVGDQLLWGAAEPIKRFLEILVEYLL